MSYTSLIEHWLRCHELLLRGRPAIDAPARDALRGVRLRTPTRASPTCSGSRASSRARAASRSSAGSTTATSAAGRSPGARRAPSTDIADGGRDARGAGRPVRLQPQAAGAPDAAGAGRLMPRERGSANDNYSRLPAPVITAGREALTGWHMLSRVAAAAARVPHRRRPAQRHDLALPLSARAPAGAAGDPEQGRALLRHAPRPQPALVPGALPDAGGAAAARARRGRAGGHRRGQPLLPVPSRTGRRGRRRPCPMPA